MRTPLLLALVSFGCSNSTLTNNVADDDSDLQALFGAEPIDWVPGGVQIITASGLTCSGMLVSDTEVLTAAHCVVGLSSVQVCTSPNVCEPVAERIAHPDYAMGSGVDLAVLRMNWDLTGLESYELPSHDVALDVVGYNAPLTLFGFGQTETGERHAARKVVDSRGTSNGLLRTGGGVCRADDGGGVVAERGEHSFLVAIATGAQPCDADQIDHQGLYDHMDWLTETLTGERVYEDDHRDTPITLTSNVMLEGELFSTDADTFLVDLRVPGTVTADLLSDMPMQLALQDRAGQAVTIGDELPAGMYTLSAWGWWGDEETDYVIDLNVEASGAELPDVVLTEIYGGRSGYGCTRPTFVEMVNKGSAPADLSTLRLDVFLENRSTWSSLSLPELTLAPGQAAVVLPMGCTAPEGVVEIPLFGSSSWSIRKGYNVSLRQGSGVIDTLKHLRTTRDNSTSRPTLSRFDAAAHHDAVSTLLRSRGLHIDGSTFDSLFECLPTVQDGWDEQITGTLVGADDLVTPLCTSSTGGDSLVRWSAPADGCYVFDTVGSAIDTVLTLQSACADQELACNDDAGGELTSALTVDVVAGDEVVLAISGYDNEEGDWVLNAAACP